MLPILSQKKNNIADFESRNVKDNLEWALKDHIFTKVKIKLGQSTIDLFASRETIRSTHFILSILTLWLLE